MSGPQRSDDEFWSAQVEDYLGALERGDRTAALGRVGRLRQEGHSVLTLVHRLLAPAQLRVGELWATDAWSVAQEHAATAVSEVVLHSLAEERRTQPSGRRDAPSLVVTCVEQEWHALPALMVSEQLRAEGFEVTYLGANSSAQGLVRHVHETGPAAVLLSCSLSTYLPLLRRQLEAVRETGTPVVVGGGAFDAEGRRARLLGASGFATSAGTVAEVVRALPAAVPPAEPLSHPGAAEAFLVFGEREQLADRVTELVLEALGETSQAPGARRWLQVLDDQLPHLVGSVAGALVVDEPAMVAEAVGWTTQVLHHRGAPEGIGAILHEAMRSAHRDLPVTTRMLAPAPAPSPSPTPAPAPGPRPAAS